MKRKVLITLTFIAWIAATVLAGTWSYKSFVPLTDFVLVTDIIECYFYPFMIFAIPTIYIISKIKRR